MQFKVADWNTEEGINRMFWIECSNPKAYHEELRYLSWCSDWAVCWMTKELGISFPTGVRYLSHLWGLPSLLSCVYWRLRCLFLWVVVLYHWVVGAQCLQLVWWPSFVIFMCWQIFQPWRWEFYFVETPATSTTTKKNRPQLHHCKSLQTCMCVWIVSLGEWCKPFIFCFVWSIRMCGAMCWGRAVWSLRVNIIIFRLHKNRLLWAIQEWVINVACPTFSM